MLDGKVGIDTYTDVMVNRPEARALLKKVRRYRIDDGKMYSGAVGYNDVLVRTTRGEFKAREDRAPGSPAWPMSAAERDEKFLDCAGRVLGSAGARRVLDLLVAIGVAPRHRRAHARDGARAGRSAPQPQRACRRHGEVIGYRRK